MKRVVLCLLGMSLLVVLTGCETVKGLGHDITNTGSAMQGALSNNKK